MEAITIATNNTVPNLSYTPTNNFVIFAVNNGIYPSVSATGEFTVSGTGVTFSSSNAQFTLAPGDVVTAIYTK
jgi:hypothetical protein